MPKQSIYLYAYTGLQPFTLALIGARQHTHVTAASQERLSKAVYRLQQAGQVEVTPFMCPGVVGWKAEFNNGR